MSKKWIVPFLFRFLFPLILLLSACTSCAGEFVPQGGAVFSGSLTLDRAGNNATAAGGEISFTTTADGTGIESLSYSLTGDSCTVEGVSVQGVGSSVRQDPPVAVQNGGFVWDPGQIRVTGTFTSPTQAEGTITIEIIHDVQTSLNAPATKQVLCDYGTWAWNAEAE
jgi:hypothetical protein